MTLASKTYNQLKPKQRLVAITLFLLLMLPNFLFIWLANPHLIEGRDPSQFPFLNKLSYLLVAAVILLLPLLVVRKLKTYFIIGFFFLPIAILECLHISILKSSISQGVIESFLAIASQNEEIMNMGTSYLNYSNISLAILYIGVYTLLFLWLPKNIRVSDTKAFKVAVAFALVISVTFSAEFIRNLIVYKNDNISQNFGKSVEYFQMDILNHTYPLGFLLDLSASASNLFRYHYFKGGHVNIQSYQKDSIQQNQVYILVLGETARFQNFGINGYHRNTTPLLSNVSNLLSFKNVLSVANLTSISLPLIITKGTPLDNASRFQESSIIEVMNSAGFSTYWIGHQVQNVRYHYDRYKDEVTHNIPVNAKYDGAFIKVLDSVLQQPGQKKFIVLHTRGSHYRYDRTYPENFKKFRPVLTPEITMIGANSKNKALFVNSYDNSIAYTDFVLNGIINKLNKNDAIGFMYYISDHGENLLDDNRGLFLHGYLTPSVYELKVPLFIWTSTKYNEKFQNKLETLKSNVESKISSNFTFHTLLDMAHISFKEEELEKSFASKMFNTNQNRYFLKVDNTYIQLD